MEDAEGGLRSRDGKLRTFKAKAAARLKPARSRRMGDSLEWRKHGRGGLGRCGRGGCGILGGPSVPARPCSQAGVEHHVTRLLEDEAERG